MRMSKQGIPRQFRAVNRRKRSEMPTKTTVPDMAFDDKTNVNLACNIFLADLANINAWPSHTEKVQMISEAMSQANANARSKGRRQTDLTTTIHKKVRE